jgi:hypothetical protein
MFVHHRGGYVATFAEFERDILRDRAKAGVSINYIYPILKPTIDVSYDVATCLELDYSSACAEIREKRASDLDIIC